MSGDCREADNERWRGQRRWERERVKEGRVLSKACNRNEWHCNTEECCKCFLYVHIFFLLIFAFVVLVYLSFFKGSISIHFISSPRTFFWPSDTFYFPLRSLKWLLALFSRPIFVSSFKILLGRGRGNKVLRGDYYMVIIRPWTINQQEEKSNKPVMGLIICSLLLGTKCHV